MLTSLKIKVKPDEKTRLSFHLGSLLQGYLMQNIDSDYANNLHNNELKPYSQFLYFDKEAKSWIWKINTINEEAREKIILPLINNPAEKIKIESKNIELLIEEKSISAPEKYKNLAEKYFIEKPFQKKIVLNFLSPTSFKSGGNFSIFPEIHNIYSSLFNKWNGFASEISLEDKDALDHLIKHTKLIGYDLRSTKFGMEGVKINSFLGEVCLYVNGPESLTRIANLLFAFAEYSGIGAKTAVGMGGVRVE